MDSDRASNVNGFVNEFIRLINDYSMEIIYPMCLKMFLWLNEVSSVSVKELKNTFKKAVQEYSEGSPLSHLEEKYKISFKLERFQAENLEIFRQLHVSPNIDVLAGAINSFIDKSQISSSVKYSLLMHLLVAHVYETGYLSEERVKNHFGKALFLFNAVHGTKPKHDE